MTMREVKAPDKGGKAGSRQMTILYELMIKNSFNLIIKPIEK